MIARKLITQALAACAVMLFAFVGSASAQSGKLTGVVTDATSGQPLAGVQVYLEGTGRGVLTQENGRYFIVNVPAGVYTVSAQLIGYATMRKENIQVSIDQTRVVDFEMPSQAVAVQEIVVEAERVPLVPQGQTGSVEMITKAEIEALPVTNIMGVLALEQGFLQVPVDNTEVVTYAQQRQGVTPLRIRGGRGAETAVMIDGIPINNFVLGGPAFDITNKAIEQVAFLKGQMEAQYGNALSGVINYATREGQREFQGDFEYRTSAVGGALGSGYDEARDWDMLEGFVSGPVPGTGDRLRFMIAGRQQYGFDRAYEFDDDIFVPSNPSTAFNQPHPLDVIPGWRAIGYDQERDIYSKLTYYFTPAAKLNFSAISYRRATKPFDFDWMLALDPLPFQTTREDSAYYLGRPGFMNYRNLVQSSLRLNRDLYVLRWDHTVGRTAYNLTGGVFEQDRVTCNVMSGVCLGAHFEDPNFSDSFVGPGPAVYKNTPTAGTDYFFGGEDLRTLTGRGDIQSQVSDHHSLSAGVFFQQHDLLYDEWQNLGTNDVLSIQQYYKAKPWDGALYLQDKIEYDFLTLVLGARFDYGKASGLFFANPVDPTNGTTALEVCANPGAWQNVAVREYQADEDFPNDRNRGTITTETLSADMSWTQQSCGDVAIRNQAARIAASDDFKEAKARKQFSPRIGVSLPVTESSTLFFNFGRYSQNPILRNTYQNTGIGTVAEGTTIGPALTSTQYTVPYVGNPHLLTEQATTYEIGYTQTLDNTYALSTVVYSKDQSGLTGVARVGQFPYTVSDPGVTYGTSTPQYTILLNQDFATTRGFELSFRRRVQDYWGFDLNYGYSESTTNAADPEREFEATQDEGDPQLRRETRSEIDQPHVFSGVLRFAVGEDTPDMPFGNALRHTNLSFVVRAASGLPYTPTLTFSGLGDLGQTERYSGRMPSTFSMDMQVRKDFRLNNLRYGAFVNVNNLTDRVNCVQVLNSTGSCLGGTEDQNRRAAGNTVGSGTFSTFYDRPFFIGRRRSIDAGVRVTF